MTTQLKLQHGSVNNYDSIGVKNEGIIYFATETDDRAYIYIGNKNVIPRNLDLRNGGLGLSLSADELALIPKHAIYLYNSDYKSSYITPAVGALYTLNANDKPSFGTMPVKVGGTGKTSFAAGAILYGNGSNVLNALSINTNNGYVLISNGSAPIYAKPTMSWTNGSTAGPIFNFTFNESKIVGSAIPAASTSVSGVITTGAQEFTGQKTWYSLTYASDILPRTSGSYSLGSSSHLWKVINGHKFVAYDDNKVQNGESQSTSGTTSTVGTFNLYLGNETASGTAGNSQGNLYLYGSNSGSAHLYYTNEATNTSQMIPATDGVIMVSDTDLFHNAQDGSYYLPIYTGKTASGAISISSMKLGFSDGFFLQHKNGDTSTSPGKSYLYLGNSTKVGTNNNLTGGLIMYGNERGGVALFPNKSQGDQITSLYLPAAAGELVYHTENAAQGGSGKLIQVSAEGQITTDTSTNIASNKKLMYLSAGQLTASNADVGGNKQFVYLSKGEITASTDNIATDGKSIMYLSSGSFTKSTVSVANTGTQLMYLNEGTLTASTANAGNDAKFVYLKDGTITPSTQSLGSVNQPVYLSGGTFYECNAYSGLLTDFSYVDNDLSLSVGGTTKTAKVVNAVSYSWTGGAAAGPKLTVTVNGESNTAASASAIPAATYSASGIVTTGNQTFGGVKTFGSGIKIAGGNSTTDCATFSYNATTDTLTVSFPSA